MKEAGIRATMKPVDGVTLSAQVQGQGAFVAYVGPGGGASTDAALFGKYRSEGTANLTKINDPKLDQLIAQQATLGRDPDGCKKVLRDIQRPIIDQGYVHNFFTYESPVVFQPYVRDFFDSFGAANTETDKFVPVWLEK